MSELVRGAVVYANFNPVKGHEQAGHRPAVVIASADYLASIPSVVVVLPVTRTSRGFPHHVELRGVNLELEATSYAMTEQPRTIDRSRLGRTVGHVDNATMREIDSWMRDFLGLGV